MLVDSTPGEVVPLISAAVVYDCMDELSAFAGAPRALRSRKEEVYQQAEVLLTGGLSCVPALDDALARSLAATRPPSEEDKEAA